MEVVEVVEEEYMSTYITGNDSRSQVSQSVSQLSHS